ncbi:MAG: hypothetical protein ACJ72Z_04850 [Pyrinomonadaceae bacterium]
MVHDAERTSGSAPAANSISNRLVLLLSAVSAFIYYFSNPKPGTFYDYTFRVAENLLHGSAGFTEKPPQWLNEFVPFEGFWYSVFPFGAVISTLPFAILKAGGLISQMPSAFIAAICAGVGCAFMLLIARSYPVSRSRAVLMTLGILFGTWTWTNITFGGAWQLAIGFALVGELGAIYFTVVNRRPLIAGAFFALAFGNRTEILLTAPIFLYWLWNRAGSDAKSEMQKPDRKEALGAGIVGLALRQGHASAGFCIVPFVLGVATLIYNYARFHSISDFGYARIPGVLNEPWYNHGIFSPYYIPRQMWEMLFKMWEWRPTFPLPMPNPFSSSILISSPFLLFAFRPGARDRVLKYLCWAAVLLICIVLWMHGNSGGWQFGYRYAVACLPFLFVIMLESAPKKITSLEWAAYGFSFIANAYVTWLFHWTDYLKP